LITELVISLLPGFIPNSIPIFFPKIKPLEKSGKIPDAASPHPLSNRAKYGESGM
jgi:hypothetical protein